MKQLRPFQIVLIGIFIFTAIVSLFIIANWRGDNAEHENLYGTKVEIWGPLSAEVFQKVISEQTDEDKNFSAVSYRWINAGTFELELLNAIAEGRSPDLIVLPHDDLVRYRSKLVAIAPEQFPERFFEDTYIEGAGIFKLSDGIYAQPFAVDPLMMYWNRDLFSRGGIVNPPTTWEILKTQTAPTLTERLSNLDIVRSAVALGEYQNIRNAKAIILLLALQSGSSLVTESKRDYNLVLDTASRAGTKPLTSAFGFFTEFSNRLLPTYSWSRALPEDRQFFLSGDLGIYFGFGSEAIEIQNLNPNLNFDLAVPPQGDGATILRNYGRFYGFAVPRTAANKNGALAAARVLSGERWADVLTRELNLAPVHKSLVATSGKGPFRQVIVSAALTARGWLDPHPENSAVIFKTVTEAITSGRQRVGKAVAEGLKKLKLEYEYD